MVVINFWLISFCLFPGAQYVKCRAQRCTEGNRQYLFPGHVDTNSLVVQDEYVFTQVCIVIDYFHRLNEASRRHLFMQRLLSMWFLIFFFFFSLSFVFILLSCAPNSSFSIKTHVIAFSNTPVPHWPDVCFDYVLSRSCQGTLSLWVSTQTYSMPEKGTVNRQVGVRIIIHSDFDSN